MASTNPLNATFFAFKKRDKSGVMTSAAIAYAIVAIVLFAGFVALNFNAFAPFGQWYVQVVQATAAGATPPEPPAEILASIGTLMLTGLVLMFALYVTVAAFEAACLRWMIRGETGGFMGLSLGRDTWNVYLTYWMWFFLYLGFSIIGGVVSSVATVAVMFGGEGANTGAAIGIALLSRLIVNILMLYYAVRLAPASATSVGLKKFAFFDAWKVTKGRFWALFGSFFLLFLMIFAGEVVIFFVLVALVFPGLFAALASLATDPSGAQIEQALSAGMNAQGFAILGAIYLIVVLLSLIVYVAFYGINARAVVAAAEDGKLEGIQTAAVAGQFD